MDGTFRSRRARLTVCDALRRYYNKLKAYRDGTHKHEVTPLMAKSLSDADIGDFAGSFGSLKMQVHPAPCCDGEPRGAIAVFAGAFARGGNYQTRTRSPTGRNMPSPGRVWKAS